MRAAPMLIAVALLCCACGGSTSSALDFGYPLDATLRLNHAQLKGTHNSYHQRPTPLYVNDYDYSHAPLDVQLQSQGVRQLELDVHWLPDDARFAVYHLPALDPLSSCHWLTDCLGLVRAWSDAHRGHFPIFIFIEPKDDVDNASMAIAPHLDALDAEVRSVFPTRLFTPDALRGAHASVQAALAADGWPTLGAVRGDVLFVLLDTERAPGKPMYEYTHGLTNLDGRAMFTLGEATDPFVAVLSLEDPINDGPATAAAIHQGLIVRTLVDDGHGAQITGTAERDAALAGDASIISSDYPVPGLVPGYSVELPDGTPVRCHPLAAPSACTDDALEGPTHLEPRNPR
ncbi:MAG: hypothetical protein JST92_20160 [Deltaproteobacteria bacterium]|nr:hypothetical protein [Deltaproteobacteria bacterium]